VHHRDGASLPARLPSAAQVAAGWRAHAERGLRCALPDARLQEAVDVCRARLALIADGSVAPVLDAWGRHDEAAARLPACLDSGDDALVLQALSAHARLADDVDVDVVRSWADTIETAAQRVAASLRPRRRRPPAVDPATAQRALAAAAELFVFLGDRRAAADAAALGRRRDGDDGAAAGMASEVVRARLASASATWTWPDGDAGVVDLLAAVRAVLVGDEDGAGGADRVVDVLAVLPAVWRGASVDVRDAPTTAGLLSYAVRWHGERAALLWELVRRDAGATTVLRTPALDPTWSTTETAGEVLLGPSPVP
jgi:hypothetical protein